VNAAVRDGSLGGEMTATVLAIVIVAGVLDLGYFTYGAIASVSAIRRDKHMNLDLGGIFFVNLVAIVAIVFLS